MGTRSITKIYSDKISYPEPNLLCSIYQQFDGYPSGVGAELAEFAKGMKIINGILGGEQKAANGMGCFAAQLIAHLKTDIGGVYMDDPDPENQEEYTYSFYAPDELGNEPIMVCESEYHGELFRGPVSEFDAEKAETTD